VALLARGREALDATARDVGWRGGTALVVPTDVADPDAVEDAADRIERELGPIDVWVNNAMVSIFAPLSDISAADYRRVTEVTYLGCVHGTMAALHRMLPRDAGVIVQVGSALAYRAIPFQSAYCGAKHAIEGFTESLRCELKHERSNVRVSMVQLPAINTPHFDRVKTTFDRHPQPVPPIFQPEVAADAIVWAAAHPRREYWVGWSTARAVIANRLVPGLLDRYLGRTGFDAQQTDQHIGKERPHNLYEPVAADAGARGEFDKGAATHSLQWRLSKARRSLSRAGSRREPRRRGTGSAN
jgi:NAD(P)-dependent dehydrogenase (short-subunit alcohol dehydrogenase family)